MKRVLLLIVLIGLLVIVEITCFEWIPRREGEELLFFPSGKFLQGITLGFDNLIADFIWIEAGVYFGGHRMTDRKYPYLYHILDVLTDLDSRFLPAYTIGSILLSDDVKRIDLSMKLLNKGMLKNPDSWEIPFLKGFIHYLFTKNYREASKWFLISSMKENAPDMTFKFATWTLIAGEGVDVALKLWLRFYNISKSALMKEKAIKGISKVLSDQAFRFKEDRGYSPRSLWEMVEENYIPFIPRIDIGEFVLKEDKIIIE
ncbi:hypothetical protein KAT89_01640 [candidate division WOR-3 bacterium]|nr:hypothetical protein [candidate division WOR-3 bacterium]